MSDTVGSTLLIFNISRNPSFQYHFIDIIHLSSCLRYPNIGLGRKSPTNKLTYTKIDAKNLFREKLRWAIFSLRSKMV